MNVGIVTYWFERGAAIVSRAYQEALSAQHRVFIYARGGELSGRGDPNWDRPDVTWGKPVTDRLPTYIDWRDFKAWVTTHHLDAIIFNEQHSWDVIVRCQDLAATIGAYVDYYTADTIPFFGLYDFLLCNTQRHHSVFTQHPQAVYIPWGTDCQLFQPTVISGGPVRFFHSAGMGGVELRKGTDILVRAFQQVTGNARLIIHSQVGLDRYASVASLIHNDPRIEFIEATVGAPGLYHLGDVYVYPSRLEGIGLTIAEALACGLPVITTDCAPMNEFVQKDFNGKLVSVERYEQRVDGYYWPQSICSEPALTQAMQFYVDHVAELAQYRQQARDSAVSHFNWRTNGANLAEAITRFRKIDKPRELSRAALAYEHRSQSNLHMAAAFDSYTRDDLAQVRHQLPRGIRYNPRWLFNSGIWAMAFNAAAGRKVTHLLKPLRRKSV
ncbi:MAG TPA: glycosyltransferase family 4 protein [Polyangiaceae bacterium]